MTDFIVIIPARLQSTRLPEKLLKTIGDKTVLEHTYLSAKKSQAKRVVIAADDEKIVALAESFGAEVILTRQDHESGTDRLAECVEKLRLSDDEIVVNLQGDEPFMPPEFVNHCARTLANSEQTPVATLAARWQNADDIANPNVVKVVMNQSGHALYFSRAAIPFNRDQIDLEMAEHYFHHLGIYAYRANFLKLYRLLPKSHLEYIEKLEQLRILDAGEKIAVGVVANKPPKGIDTEEDLQAAQAFFASR